VCMGDPACSKGSSTCSDICPKDAVLVPTAAAGCYHYALCGDSCTTMGAGAGAAMPIVHPRVKGSASGAAAASPPTRCTTLNPHALPRAPPGRVAGEGGLEASVPLAFWPSCCCC
jgi:hypothetical protein